jgi:hypothetical protein
MWPFSTAAEKERLLMGKDTEGTQERIEILEKKLRRIEEEWTEVYGKFRTLQMRVAKQVQRLEENSSPEETTQAEGGVPEDGPGPATASLTPAQRRLNAQILARRRGLIHQGGE